MQEPQPIKNKLSALRSLYRYVISIFILLALPSIGVAASASQPSAPTTAQLLQVVEAHYRAIEDNQFQQAMTYYHSLSPDRARVSESVEFGLSQFLLKTATLRFCYIGQEGEIALATARHKFLRITGIKFIVQNVVVAYQLREEQGSWKIWTQREDPDSIITLSNCVLVQNTIWVVL